MEELNYDAVANAKAYHKAQMIKTIIQGMDVNVNNIFDEIENVYTCGEQISQYDLIELVKEVRKDIEALEIYIS